jgi:hypothetical protein
VRGAALLLALVATVWAQPKPTYEVYAVKYATIPDFAVNQLVAGAETGRKLDTAPARRPGT